MTVSQSLHNTEQGNKPIRHIVALSGGKDSSALAIYLRGKIQNIEYVFCDTEKELDETYEYLEKLESFLGKKIHHLQYANGYGFDDILDMKKGFLPSSEERWCTDFLKIKPYEQYIGNDSVISYVGLRADEPHRTGYISTKPNIKTVFPFKENNLHHEDIMRILEESGLGLPSYYQWRSRSGCYFCFFQQKREWVGLLENHPKLFAEAKKYEKVNPKTGTRFTWMQNESLEELEQPGRVAKIKADYEKRKKRLENSFKENQKLMNIWADDPDDEFDFSCNICHF